jgi:hypothetical protein
LAAVLPDDLVEDSATGGLVGDDGRGGGQIGFDAVLEVEGEPRVGAEVGEPGAWGGVAGEIQWPSTCQNQISIRRRWGWREAVR